MVTKICTLCKKEFPIDHFHWRNKEKGIRISRCKYCSSKLSKNHYTKNPNMYKKKARKWEKIRRKETMDMVMEFLLKNPCVDCGESDPLVLTFDHVRGKKEGNVSNLVHQRRSWTIVKKEIDKCEVRCANCHTRKTSIQMNFWKINI